MPANRIWKLRVMKCVVCHSIGERMLDDSLPWQRNGQTVESICYACLEVQCPWMRDTITQIIGSAKRAAERTEITNPGPGITSRIDNALAPNCPVALGTESKSATGSSGSVREGH